MIKRILSILMAISISLSLTAAKKNTDANVVGHVVCKGEHLPYVSVYIKGTTIGSATDETGHFQLINLPQGEHTIVAQMVGYKQKEIKFTAVKGKTKEIKFNLEEDLLGLEEVVVTGDRNKVKRKESLVIVNSISPKLLKTTQSINISEGLAFCPGLRVENNCQNCGFTQLRMNGMEGPYSQILINSRPIFSGLAGVYGLELIPSNMIERIEVIRGGGSALYGSNAIAGTVNLILKDPIHNHYEMGYSMNIIGKGNSAIDQNFTANVSVVSANHNSGMSLYAFHRNKDPYDANGDDFSEISKVLNTTFGTRGFHRINDKNKIVADFFVIDENRRGGNKFDYPNHEADISEALQHTITSGAINYESFISEKSILNIFGSFQNVNRDSYYGAEQALDAYGHTTSFTYATGATYKSNFQQSNLVVGVENTGEWLKDKKLGYLDIGEAYVDGNDEIVIPRVPNSIIADQHLNTTGAYFQYDYKFARLKVSAGMRYDHYKITEKEHSSDISGNVFSPRVNLLYDLSKNIQLRTSYSQGYRVPQIFDEDLHIETSASRRVIHKNDPDLKQETSHSFMASINFHRNTDAGSFELLLEGFYTILDNPFANEYGTPDAEGTVIYTRVNAQDGAKVQGINAEFTFIPSAKFNLKAGFTVQSSKFDTPVEFDEKKFFRSPDNYGFLNMLWLPKKSWELSATANYTGKMLIPYFGNSEDGELRTSKSFMEIGCKIKKEITFKKKKNKLGIYAGVKNIFNSYQDDFDFGDERDPGYIYGPNTPRTFYFGVTFGI